MIDRLRSTCRFAGLMTCVLTTMLPIARGDEPDATAKTETECGFVHPLDMRPQPWQRRDEPVLSANTTRQSWCKVVLYSPSVMFKDGKFKMWYVGSIYCASRDWRNTYLLPDGSKGSDAAGVYAHIGVAVIPKKSASQ